MKIEWTLIAISLLVACSKEDNNPGKETVSLTDATWQLSESKENNQENTYPVTVKGDFDNDGTEETLSRSDFYIFENGWAIRAYSYTVINDKGNDVGTLQNRSGHLFAAAASPYTITGENISVFLKEYTISLDGTELKLQSDNHQLLFVETKTIDRDLVKNAPLEPENNGDLASKTWRMKYETGFEAKPDIFYPVEKTGDFDGDDTDETITRDDYYVFDIPWCYTAYMSTVVNDKGSDTLSLQNSNGVLQIKHINYFVFNEARDTIHFNGNAYAYSINGENIMLKRGNYEAMFESVPAINSEHIKAMYEDDTW